MNSLILKTLASHLDLVCSQAFRQLASILCVTRVQQISLTLAPFSLSLLLSEVMFAILDLLAFEI